MADRWYLEFTSQEHMDEFIDAAAAAENGSIRPANRWLQSSTEIGEELNQLRKEVAESYKRSQNIGEQLERAVESRDLMAKQYEQQEAQHAADIKALSNQIRNWREKEREQRQVQSNLVRGISALAHLAGSSDSGIVVNNWSNG